MERLSQTIKKGSSTVQIQRSSSLQQQQKYRTPSETKYDSSLKKRCERIIYRNKYERNAPEICSWWFKLFKILEDDASIPPEEQLSILKELFEPPLLDKIIELCGIKERKYKEMPFEEQQEDIQDQVDSSSRSTNKRIINSVKTQFEEEDLKQVKKEMHAEHPNSLFYLEKPVEQREDITRSKMYINFFKRKPTRAAVWRPLPPPSLSEMNLSQKADYVTEQIATDFINWLRDLGGDEELSLSVQSIIEMFQIGFQANTATSLKVCLKELASIPKRVAEAKQMPKRATRAVLRKEIRKDIKASKKQTTYTAFSTYLPPDMQVRPPAESFYKKWMSCDRVPEKLASMATVWQGITHLKSTRAYCEFLLERPEIKPPKYLFDCGMMEMENLIDKDEDFESRSLDSMVSG
ncbi:uncharacterized protein LOC126737296 [Anthonomus grandis grandis]|uniref:uncharacterized protein LOC126737296 n=1 Tax=Anthonomus grandis grandis TaxID=2921223 RepID=UPI00216635E1|nr:uncharacterized protein LOC126737296 [Anthonomus grandis grandis]